MKNKKTKCINDKTIFIILVWILYIIWILKFSSLAITITNFIIHLLFLCIVIFIFKDDLLKNIKDLNKEKKKVLKIFLCFLAFLAVMLISNITISLSSEILGIDITRDSSSGAIAKVFENTPYGTLFACFLTIIFYPVVEELIFRKSLRPAIKNGCLFVIITSLLSWYFQVTLLNPSINEFILAIQTFLNSIFAGIVYVKTNNITYTISSRMLFNTFICIMQFSILILG